ncbi:MAG: helix-turn-helix domain-containing protein [Candidatus Nanoarchaeia archaeon]|nr:helix-turn-helix domain-containing protein [Candidatus Nanoarchaeia archaeon]MDD5588148.1 helix-turn-helix domain-containing protein [Candidatus Nanoarchaeia archaeon]
MDIKTLEGIGLTKTEIKIYLALLKLGQTTTTNIVRNSGIHASKVYEFLDKLIQKGLVSYVIKSNKKYFSASDPEYLKEFLREKREKLIEQGKEVDKIIPELKSIQKSKKNFIKSEIYEGLRGIKSIYERMLLALKKGETQYIIGAPRIANEQIEGFLLDWHKRRIKKGIRCKYIYDSNVKDYGGIRNKMPLTEVRYLPKNIISPMWIEIFKDFIVIGHIKEYNAILFLIQDKEIAEGYRDYFNLIWETSTN